MNGETAGENIYWDWNSNQVTFDGTKPVDAWYGEIANFTDPAKIDSFGNSVSGTIGHYT